jgi:hypothetical protein
MLSVGLVYAPRVWSGGYICGSESSTISTTVKTIVGYKLVDGLGWVEYSTLWNRMLTADEIRLEKKRLGI